VAVIDNVQISKAELQIKVSSRQ